MTGTLSLTIGPEDNRLVLEYDLLTEAIPDGLRLVDKETGDVALLWDAEINAAVLAGGGPTTETALLMRHLIDQKFDLES
jgi:hypothetical protein